MTCVCSSTAIFVSCASSFDGSTMKFSESWLRTLVDPTVSGPEFSHLLTMAGLEVEEEERVAPHFDNVVVAHVLEVSKHPDADRLNVCRVDIGRGETQQIVCGAPNVA